MPRIFVAVSDKKDDVPRRLVTGGLANLKKEMKEYPDTRWVVSLYNFKPSVDNICTLIKGITSKKAMKLVTENYEFEVNSGGRLRQVS